MKKKLALLLTVTTLNAWANEKTDKVWQQQLKNNGINFKDQSYCYLDKDHIIQGQNVDMRIRLASVSKIFTTLWAVDSLGVEYRYNTRLYIKGNNLHIEGSYDPFLGNEKMFFLMSQLNDLGFTKFDKITFDKKLLVYPNAQYSTDEYPTLNANTNKKWLGMYFNTKSWNQDFKNEYQYAYDLSKIGRMRKEVSFEVTSVEASEENPYLNDPETRVLTLTSPDLYKYLKEMNVKSNNYVAETIFRQLGGLNKFEQFLKEKYNLDNSKIYFYSGSGLPSYVSGERKDNYATCHVALDLVSELKREVETHGKEIEDVVAVPGSDKGTFRNRLFPEELKNSFVAKTGTLMHTSTLAGAMSTKDAFTFFGIFNQTEDIHGAKNVQNEMVKSIISELGGPVAFNYEYDVFRPYNKNEDVKKFYNDIETDFTPYDINLY